MHLACFRQSQAGDSGIGQQQTQPGLLTLVRHLCISSRATYASPVGLYTMGLTPRQLSISVLTPEARLQEVRKHRQRSCPAPALACRVALKSCLGPLTADNARRCPRTKGFSSRAAGCCGRASAPSDAGWAPEAQYTSERWVLNTQVLRACVLCRKQA